MSLKVLSATETANSEILIQIMFLVGRFLRTDIGVIEEIIIKGFDDKDHPEGRAYRLILKGVFKDMSADGLKYGWTIDSLYISGLVEHETMKVSAVSIKNAGQELRMIDISRRQEYISQLEKSTKNEPVTT